MCAFSTPVGFWRFLRELQQALSDRLLVGFRAVRQPFDDATTAIARGEVLLGTDAGGIVLEDLFEPAGLFEEFRPVQRGQ
jgi:hypothetical protein